MRELKGADVTARRKRALTAKEAGAAVRDKRKAKGLSQAKLAELAGVSRKFVGDLEAGHDRAELGKALLVFEVVGVEVLEARQMSRRYAPSLKVDVNQHLGTFKRTRKLNPL
jgi:y4mF family transcriptional regulator